MRPRLNCKIEDVNWCGLGVWAAALITACYQILYSHGRIAKVVAWGVIVLFCNVLLVNLFACGRDEVERG